MDTTTTPLTPEQIAGMGREAALQSRFLHEIFPIIILVVIYFVFFGRKKSKV